MIYWSNKEPQIIRRLLPFSPRPKDRYSYRANIFYLALCNVTEKKNKNTAPWRATWLAALPSPPAASAQASLPGWGTDRALPAPSEHPLCCSSLPSHTASCLRHPRENRSGLPSSHSLAIPFWLPRARGILSCLIPASLPHAEMGILGSRVCSQHELGCTGGVARLANGRPH